MGKVIHTGHSPPLDFELKRMFFGSNDAAMHAEPLPPQAPPRTGRPRDSALAKFAYKKGYWPRKIDWAKCR